MKWNKLQTLIKQRILIDFTSLARNYGFRCPTYISSSLYNKHIQRSKTAPTNLALHHLLAACSNTAKDRIGDKKITIDLYGSKVLLKFCFHIAIIMLPEEENKFRLL